MYKEEEDLCGRPVQRMMILPHVSCLIFPEPFLSLLVELLKGRTNSCRMKRDKKRRGSWRTTNPQRFITFYQKNRCRGKYIYILPRHGGKMDETGLRMYIKRKKDILLFLYTSHFYESPICSNKWKPWASEQRSWLPLLCLYIIGQNGVTITDNNCNVII